VAQFTVPRTQAREREGEPIAERQRTRATRGAMPAVNFKKGVAEGG
jgi:hypothetical protein